jgi:hypothetical protein
MKGRALIRRSAFCISREAILRKSIFTVLICSLVLALTGCGGGGEKDKNKYKDVPKAAKSEAAG